METSDRYAPTYAKPARAWVIVDRQLGGFCRLPDRSTGTLQELRFPTEANARLWLDWCGWPALDDARHAEAVNRNPLNIPW